MPRAAMKRHVLRHGAIAGNAEVRGHSLPRNGSEIGMFAGRELPREQRIDPRSAKLSWRQANTMEHHERQRGSRRARILMGRRHYPCASQQAGTDVNQGDRGSTNHARSLTQPRDRICVWLGKQSLNPPAGVTR